MSDNPDLLAAFRGDRVFGGKPDLVMAAWLGYADSGPLTGEHLWATIAPEDRLRLNAARLLESNRD